MGFSGPNRLCNQPALPIRCNYPSRTENQDQARIALSSSAPMASAISISPTLCRLRFRPTILLHQHLQRRTRFVLATSNFPEKLRIYSPPPPRFIPISPLPSNLSLRSSISSMASPQSTSGALQPSLKTVRVVVKGRVQGVFYRNWTVENAKQLGLNGWVRNRRDGSVEALFSGDPDAVTEMEQRCRRGPPSAVVTGLDVSPCADDPGSGFERKQTA